MDNNYLSIVMGITSAFIALVTLFATIVIGILQIKQNYRMDVQNKQIDNRDEYRRKDAIYTEATKFILKYSAPNYRAEIYLLPLCIIAYKYNPIHPYYREIYREFCSLSEDVQNNILMREEIKVSSFKDDNFYNRMLNVLKSDINTNYPNDVNWYYDGGKYFEQALLKYGNKEIPDIKCNIDEYENQVLNIVPNDSNRKSMEYEAHIINLLAYEKCNKPIKRLSQEQTSMGSPAYDNGILISYLLCIVAKYVPEHLHRNNEYEKIGCINDFDGTRYMEDLFLNALFNIYIFQ